MIGPINHNLKTLALFHRVIDLADAPIPPTAFPLTKYVFDLFGGAAFQGLVVHADEGGEYF
jgi:hypothetical protein